MNADNRDPAQAKRSEILNAAERLFRNRRFDEVTMDEVASDAKVGKGTIYLYFQDKQDLFFQLALSGFSEIELTWQDILERSIPAGEKLIEMGERMGEMLESRESLFRLIHSQELMGRQPELKKVFHDQVMRLQKIVKSVLLSGIQEGLFRDDINLDAVECLYFGAIHGRFRRKMHQAQNLPVSTLVSLIIKGIGV